MARYNREFLVPYLQNVCALHLAHQKIESEASALRSKIWHLEQGENNPPPIKPTHYKVITPGSVLLLLFGSFGCIIMTLGVLLLIYEEITGQRDYGFWMYFLLLFCIAFCGLIFFWGYDPICEAKQHNKNEQIKYQNWVATYNQRNQLNAQGRKQIPALQQKLQNWYSEQAGISTILSNAYNVNIIPSRYRNIYAAIYLYDWFSTSQADDLDAALNMFVLEEIKDRLDTIIANQSEIILNQRIMMANQQRSIEQQQRHSAMMRSKLNQIAASNEERNIYLKMIESNTATTAYFAAADYIRRI